MLLRPEDGTFREIPLLFHYSDNSRGLGLADMAKALQDHRAMRAGCEQTLHVLEINTAFEKRSQQGKLITLKSSYERQNAMSNDSVPGILY